MNLYEFQYIGYISNWIPFLIVFHEWNVIEEVGILIEKQGHCVTQIEICSVVSC